MTPEQFTKSRAEFIKSCGKPPLHEVLGVVYDLDNVCDDLLQEHGNLRDELISMTAITFAVIEELRSNGRELPTELAAELEAHTQRFLRNCRKESRSNIESIVSAGRRAQAKAAIEARHGKEGGSRDLKEKIRAIYATGKYLTKDLCAEEEYRALGINTFGTARGYLTGEPDPNPWPAKEREQLAKQQTKGKKK